MTLLIYNLAHCTAQAIGFIVRRLNSPRKMWCCVCLGFFPVWVDFFLWLRCLVLEAQSPSEGLQNHFPSSHLIGNVGCYLRKSASLGTNNRVSI